MSLWEKRNGQISTPTCRDFARIKAGLPNAGSSATERSSAVTSPLRTLRCRLPSVTSRPSAVLRSACSVGLNWSTLIRKGRLTTATMNNAKTIPTHFAVRFKAGLLRAVYLFEPRQSGVVSADCRTSPYAYKAAEKLDGRRNRLPHLGYNPPKCLVAQAVPPAISPP